MATCSSVPRDEASASALIGRADNYGSADGRSPDAARQARRQPAVEDTKEVEMKRILVATDGSEGAQAAVADAIELAAKLEAELTFVSVEHLPPTPFGVPPYYLANPEAHHQCEQAVAEAVAAAEEAGVEATAKVLRASPDPAHDVVELARELDADLIVVGSRGHGAVASALLGSVSRSVVGHADRPVLVAKHRARVPVPG
jgi:nucleotide-binding universal stress UspA family protein